MINFIWAEDQNGGIGYHNHLPFHQPKDLNYFKTATMGHAVVMGRKTFESIGKRSLPNRANYVFTRQSDYDFKEAKPITKEELVALAKTTSVFIIGGNSVFRLFLEEVDCLYRTVVDGVYPADTYILPIDYDKFDLVKQTEEIGENDTRLTFQVWKRKTLH